MKFKLPFRRKAKTNVLPIPPRQPVPPGVFVEEARLGLLGTAPSTSDRFDFHASPEPRYTAETLQRSLADLCATHHVSLAKLREQMGNMAEPAETVLQLSARRVFAQRYMLRSRLDSTGAISDLSPALGFGPSTSTGEASKQHSGGQANDAGGSKKAGTNITYPSRSTSPGRSGNGSGGTTQRRLRADPRGSPAALPALPAVRVTRSPMAAPRRSAGPPTVQPLSPLLSQLQAQPELQMGSEPPASPPRQPTASHQPGHGPAPKKGVAAHERAQESHASNSFGASSASLSASATGSGCDDSNLGNSQSRTTLATGSPASPAPLRRAAEAHSARSSGAAFDTSSCFDELLTTPAHPRASIYKDPAASPGHPAARQHSPSPAANRPFLASGAQPDSAWDTCETGQGATPTAVPFRGPGRDAMPTSASFRGQAPDAAAAGHWNPFEVAAAGSAEQQGSGVRSVRSTVLPSSFRLPQDRLSPARRAPSADHAEDPAHHAQRSPHSITSSRHLPRRQTAPAPQGRAGNSVRQAYAAPVQQAHAGRTAYAPHYVTRSLSRASTTISSYYAQHSMPSSPKQEPARPRSTRSLPRCSTANASSYAQHSAASSSQQEPAGPRSPGSLSRIRQSGLAAAHEHAVPRDADGSPPRRVASGHSLASYFGIPETATTPAQAPGHAAATMQHGSSSEQTPTSCSTSSCSTSSEASSDDVSEAELGGAHELASRMAMVGASQRSAGSQRVLRRHQQAARTARGSGQLVQRPLPRSPSHSSSYEDDDLDYEADLTGAMQANPDMEHIRSTLASRRQQPQHARSATSHASPPQLDPQGGQRARSPSPHASPRPTTRANEPARLPRRLTAPAGQRASLRG